MSACNAVALKSDTGAPPAHLLPIEEVLDQCAISRATLYAWIKVGAFPSPVKIGASSRWLSTEIDAWIAALVAARPAIGAAAQK